MKPTLIYDGECGYCSRTVEKVRKYDTDHRIEYSPYQSIPVGEYTAADRARFREAVHFVDRDGVISWGGYILPHVMEYLPRWRKWAWFFRLNGVLWFAARIYTHTARKRHLLGTACEA